MNWLIATLPLLALSGGEVADREKNIITTDEVRIALNERRRGRMAIEPAPLMQTDIGDAVCGRIGLGAKPMPERFVYVRYPNARARFFFEKSPDPQERKRFDLTWKQLGCLGL